MLPWALPIRYLLNPRADPSLPYSPELGEILDRDAHEDAFAQISSWEGYAPTPLWALEGMARALGVDTLWYKDEGKRLGLGSFKALGGIYGVYRVLRRLVEEGVTGAPPSSRDLLEGRFAETLSGLTVCCASAGNHGRAVARGAQLFGCRSVIFLPSHTSSHRVEAIRALGARIDFVEGSFDDAVARAAEEAQARGWQLVADTAYPGYEDVPRHIMQGYTVLAREFLDQLAEDAGPTHVFLQAGVGGLAAAVTGHLWERLGSDRPRVVVVEPAEADCLLESALVSRPSDARGTMETSLECLACRRVSTLAWKILDRGSDAFLTIPDFAAEEAVGTLRRGVGEDPSLRTQPSGAAGLAGLGAAVLEPNLAVPLGLNEGSRVLVIGSEGPE